MNKFFFAVALLYSASLAFTLPASAQSWQSQVVNELPLMGHRNWILIVDSAYPAQVGPGIETVETNSDQLDVVRTVLAAVKNSIHVRPVILMDAELQLVPEKKATGVTKYRGQIASLLHDYRVSSRLHQSLIDEVAKDGAQYRVLILKTNLAIPYTSVFIHLDCKYWSAEDERELREEMRSHDAR
jgi:hypothetical protein